MMRFASSSSKCLFLMHRVELKVIRDMFDAMLGKSFLMHRVELKAKSFQN